MEYSDGMGIEMPVWVIQTASGKRTFNRKTNAFVKEIIEDCVFTSPSDAKERLKMMDFGYVVRKKHHYRDLNNNRFL